MLRVVPALSVWAVEIPATSVARGAKSVVDALNDLCRVGKNKSAEMDVRAPENAKAIYVVVKYGANIRNATLNPVWPEDALHTKVVFDFFLSY